MTQVFRSILVPAVILLLSGHRAQAEATYLLKLTNGGAMPLSPAAIYVKDGQIGNSQVGESPTAGFIQLCQSGNPALRVQELRADAKVKFVTQTTAPVLPGESRIIEISVMKPGHQSLHFETMYGKTKDICAVGAVGNRDLLALEKHLTMVVAGKDAVVQTGAFLDPAIPMGQSDANTCSGASDAIACLRELALPNGGMAKIRFFSSYLPSLINFLEVKFGTADTQTLIIPSSGAVHFQLKLKH